MGCLPLKRRQSQKHAKSNKFIEFILIYNFCQILPAIQPVDAQNNADVTIEAETKWAEISGGIGPPIRSGWGAPVR